MEGYDKVYRIKQLKGTSPVTCVTHQTKKVPTSEELCTKL